MVLDCTFPGTGSEVTLRSSTWCTGAALSSSFSLSSLNSCSPDLPENELLSLTQTAPIQLKLPSRSLRYRNKCPSWNDILQAGKLRHGVCPILFSRAPSPHAGHSLSPQGRQNSEHKFFYHRDWIMWQRGFVLAASCSECVFLLKLFPGCWQAPGFQELNPVFPSENRGSAGISKNTNSEQTHGFQN